MYKIAFMNYSRMAFIEKHRNISPVVIDFDFRQDVPESQYKQEHIEFFVQSFVKILSKMVVITKDVQCYVLAKPPRKNKENYKDGLHFTFPSIVTRPQIQYELRTQFLEENRSYFQTHVYPFANDEDTIYDEAVIERNGWLMYGSMKEDDIAPWLVKYVVTCSHLDFSIQTKELSFEEAMDDSFIDLLAIRNKFEESSYTDMGQYIIKHTKDKRQKIHPVSDDTRSIASSSNLTSASERPYSMQYYAIAHDFLLFVKMCVGYLKSSRADEYESWMRVGWCLHNIDPSLLSTWEEFSKLSLKYKDGECKTKWADMKNDGLGFGSLLQWVKEDVGPDIYSQVVKALQTLNIRKSLNGTHTDVARVIHQYFKDMYVCASIKDNIWYEFQSHRWVRIENAYTLRQRISDDVFSHYIALASEMQTKACRAELPSDAENLVEKAKSLLTVANKLKNTTFKNALITECAEIFYDPEFDKKLDSRKNLLGFNNGVYDLSSGNFREGRPDDYVSFSCKYDYIDEDDPEVQEDIMSFINSMMPNEPMATYLLSVLAYMLCGNKYLELFWFFTGRGRNGKGTIMTLMRKVLGDYYYEPDITMVTCTKTSSSAASPEVAKSKGVRLLVASEPDDSNPQCKFKANKLKQLRGNDIIQARGLYKDCVEFIPQFGMIFQMNDIPEMNKMDDALSNTLKIVHFPYVFTSNPVLANHKSINMGLKDKFNTREDYWQQFMRILVRYYKMYVHGDRKFSEPEEVMAATKEYVEENQPLLLWLQDTMEITGDHKDVVRTDELAREFKYDTSLTWSHVDIGRGMSRLGFKSKVVRIPGETTTKRAYLGLKFKELPDEVDPNDN